MTVRSDKPKPGRDGQEGFMHPLPGEAAPKIAAMKKAESAPKLKHAELKVMLKQFETALSPHELEKFAKALGVSVASLKLLQVGLDPDTGMISFPMYNGERKLCGFRLRDRHEPKMRKTFCVRGSSNGLFIPACYATHPDGPNLPADHAKPMLLLMPEGPTDVAAALDLGFRAIGRPQNTGGGPLIAELLHRAKCRQDVVIVADNDPATTNQFTGETSWPGSEGALSVAGQILAACWRLRIVDLHWWPAKDLREYQIKHGPAAMLYRAIEQSPVVTRAWLGEQWTEMEKRKVKHRELHQLRTRCAKAG